MFEQPTSFVVKVLVYPEARDMQSKLMHQWKMPQTQPSRKASQCAHKSGGTILTCLGVEPSLALHRQTPALTRV